MNTVPQSYSSSHEQAEPRSSPRLNRHAKPYTPRKSRQRDVPDLKGDDLALSSHQHNYACGNVDHSLAQAIAQHHNLVEIVPGGPLVAPDQQAKFESFVKVFPGKRKALESALCRPAHHNPIQEQHTNRWSPFPIDKESLDTIRTFLLYDDQLRKQDPPMREFSRGMRQYILDATEMVQNDFLVPTYMELEVGEVGDLGPYSVPPVWDDQWKEMKKSKEGATNNVKRVLAIDCEMVFAGEEQILSQVCLVDWFSERIVYFQYVAPPPHKVITDYVTDKSGITAATLCGVTKTLEQVQQDLLLLIQQSNTILVGHGLHTDLKVLKLSHATVVDTSLMFDPPFGRKPGPPTVWQRPKLKDLVKVYLGNQDFQNGCHSPASDALACIKLTKAKLSYGPRFGGNGWRSFKARLAKKGLSAVQHGPTDVFGSVGTPGTAWQRPSRLPCASLFSFASTANKRIEIKSPEESTPAENSLQIVAAMLEDSPVGFDDEEDMVLSDCDLDAPDHHSKITEEDGADSEPDDEYTLSIPSCVSYQPCPSPASPSLLGIFSPSAMSFKI
ncbi:hypothetical protein FS837_012658 [Tulasnella sp. UAMH 9824]|nr:hypothetical protein FS837_012658 [Tulasnella sp. UAMH 9824]